MGVKLSENLKWGSHIEEITSKAYRNLHFVMRNLRRSGREVKGRAYKTLVRPVVEYATSVWDPHETGLCKKTEGIQRKAARYVFGKHRNDESVSKMIDQLGWESLQYRRKNFRLTGIYNTWNRKDGWDELRHRFQTPTYIGRGDHLLKIKEREQKTDLAKFSFLNRGIREWNALPEEVLIPMPKNSRKFRTKLNK